MMLKILLSLLIVFFADARPPEEPGDAASKAKELSEDGFLFPPICGCTGCPRTSKFGRRNDPVYGGKANHAGCDIGAARNTPVHSPADGEVTEVFKNYKAGTGSGYGNQILIRHKSPSGEVFMSHYGHLLSIASGIEVGSKIKKGQEIGKVDSTGKSTGDHLHFEVLRCKGDGGEKDDSCQKVDPELYVNLRHVKESCEQLRKDHNVPETTTIGQ